MFFLNFIPLAVLVSVLVYGEINLKTRIIRTVKPICSLWLVALIILSTVIRQPSQIQFTGILAAMLFSLGGDMALMFQDKKKFFLAGLVLFLLGHVSYGITFTLLSGFVIYDLFSAVALAVLFFILFKLFKSGAESMLGAVIAYILIISFMTNRAISTAFSDSLNLSKVVCIIAGSILFYVSDIILAWNKFYKPFKYHRISLFFYYAGQALIISSLYT